MDEKSADAPHESTTVQEKWTQAVRDAGVILTRVKSARFGKIDGMLARFDQTVQQLEEYGRQGDEERLAQRGLSTAQFIARVRELITEHELSWLQPAIKVAGEAWKCVLPEPGKTLDQTRAAGLDWINVHLKAYLALRPGAKTRRRELEEQMLTYFTRGRPLIAPAPEPKPVSTYEYAAAIETPQFVPPVFIDPFPVQPVRPPPAASGSPFEQIAAAYFEPEQTDLEHAARTADLLWALIDCNQLLLAHHYAVALESEGGTVLPSALMKAAALSPFVVDDVSPAILAYHEALLELDFDALEAAFEHGKTLGQAALGMSASLQATLFSPNSSAPRVLRICIRGWPPEFARVLSAAVDVGELGIALTLADFSTKTADEPSTKESQYRSERVRPLVQSLLAQLPPAIEFCRRSKSTAATLEDQAGCALAATALQSLFAALKSGVHGWTAPDLDEWLKLPHRLTESTSGSVASAVVSFVRAGCDYHALAEETLASGALPRVRALLFELQRIHSTDKAIPAMQARVDERRTFVQRFDQRAQAIVRQLRESDSKQWIAPEEARTHDAWVEDLKRSAREDQSNPSKLLAELDGVAELLTEKRNTFVDQLRTEARELRKSADIANATDEVRRWFSDIERALNKSEFAAAQRYLAELRELLHRGDSGDRYRFRWLPDKRGDKTLAIPSPLTIADDIRILGLADQPPSHFTVNLLFGVPAAGLLDIPRSLESIHRQPDQRLPAYRMEFAGPTQVTTLRDLRRCANAVEFNGGEPCILHVNMPAPSVDAGFQEEILELVHKLKPVSALRRLRIVLELDAAAAWCLFVNDAHLLESDLIKLRLAPWPRIALGSLLTELQLPCGPSDIECVQQNTGGWYRYLRAFVHAARKAGTVTSVQSLFPERDGVGALSAQAARDALGSFGLDVPHMLGIFQDLVAQNVQREFDLDWLGMVIGEKAERAAVSTAHVANWAQYLGLFEPHPTIEGFRVNSLVAALLERSLLA